MGTSAAADRAAPTRGDRVAKPASAVRTAIALTANNPAAPPVTTRWVTPRPVAAQINPTRPRECAALDMRGPPGLQPGCREDHRRVGDVLDDARRGRPGRDRLQSQQVTIDDADCTETGVQAERRAADRSKAEPSGGPRFGGSTAVTGLILRDGRNHQTLNRREDFAQRQLRRQCYFGQPTVSEDRDPHDGYHSAGHHRLLRLLRDIASLSLRE